MSLDRVKTAKHPAFGNIRVSRVSGRNYLFGSDVEHNHYITVSISECDHERSLSNDWYHSGKELISIAMTEMQWGQFVSSFNQGSGTPVTLEYIQGKRIPSLPKPAEVVSVFKNEVKATANSSLASLQEAINQLKAALVPKAKTPNKGELNAMLEKLESSFRQFTNSLPFIEEQFTETVEAKLTEAKSEFEGFMNSRLQEMGLAAAQIAQAKKDAPSLLLTEGDNE